MDAQRTRPLFKALCKPDRSSDKDEVFPEFYAFPPKTGEFIQAQSGSIFQIAAIIHTAKIREGKYGNIQSPQAVLKLKKVSLKTS